jgi:hypothetical protein
MTAAGSPATEPSQGKVGYVVEEPDEPHDGLSERSPSIDEQPVRYTMAEMEAYIQLVQKDRCGDGYA